MRTSPREYVQDKGWEFKISGTELVVKVCPLCGDGKWHFYLDAEEGMYFCHKCSEKGNLVTLRRSLDGESRSYTPVMIPVKKMEPPVAPVSLEVYHAEFLASREAISYMTSRGISLETCREQKISHKAGWIGYPTFQDGRCALIKWRSLPPAEKRFIREPAGAESVLFNGDCLKNPPKEVIVTEGEIDALTLLQAGFKNVVSIPNGAGNLPEEAVRTLKNIRKVFLAYDPDLAGKKGAEAAAKRIGQTRCYRVVLPDVDVNEYFRTRTASDFALLLSEARPFSTPHVMGYDEVFLSRMERLQSGDMEKGIRPGIRSIAELVGTLRPGNVYILSAYPKIGKTLLSINLAWNVARRGISTLFYCLEMVPEEVAESLLMHINQKDCLVQDDWDNGLGKVSSSGWLFGWNPRPMDWKGTLSIIRETVRDFGVRFLVIDNFHFLCRAETEVTAQEAIVSREIKTLAVELCIPVWLIVHPRKKDSQAAEERAPTFQDLKGSSALSADASAVLVLHRPIVGVDGGGDVEHPRSPLGILRTDASRFTKGGQRRIFFDAPHMTFREPSIEEISVFATQRPARRLVGNRGMDRMTENK
jgi:hypothetical protein